MLPSHAAQIVLESDVVQLTEDLPLIRTPVIIRGVALNVVINGMDQFACLVFATGSSGSQIRDLTVTGCSQHGLHLLGRVSQVILQSVNAFSNNGDGVHVVGGIGTRVLHCHFASNRAGGITLSGQDHTVEHSKVGTDLKGLAPLPNTRDGILARDCAGCRIEHNLISGNGAPGNQDSFALVLSGANATASNNTIGTDIEV